MTGADSNEWTARRAAWHRSLRFLYVVVVLLVVTKGPLYRVRWQAATLRGDFLDDRWTQGAWCLLYAPALVALWRSRVDLRRILLPALSVALLCLVLLGSTAWSVSRDRTAVQAALMIMTTGAAVWIGLRVSPRSFVRALVVSQHLGVVISVWAVARRWALSRDIDGKWAGIYFNRNSLAAPAVAGLLAVIVAVADLWFSHPHRSLRVRLTSLVVGLILVAADVHVIRRSGSLTPVLALIGTLTIVVAVAAIFRLSRRPRLGERPLTAILVLAGLSAWQIALAARSHVLEFLGRSPTLESRTIVWAVGREFIHRRLWVGWGFFAVWRRPEIHHVMQTWDFEHFVDVNEAHSGYYEVALGAGVLGVLALGACCFVAVWAATRGVVRGTGVLRFWSLTLVSYALIVNLTETYIGPNLLPWVLLVAATVQGWQTGDRGARQQAGHFDINHTSRRVPRS